MRFADYQRTVVGFHGTTLAKAQRIVSGQTFPFSRNQDDWLGHGIYFWEYAPKQAWEWAKQRYAPSTQIAVIGSMIRLGNCFDLLDPANVDALVAGKQFLERTMRVEGKNCPEI